MHHVSQTLSTSDDDACKTLNEVKVVNLVTVTTLTRSMVVTRHIINDVLVDVPDMHTRRVCTANQKHLTCSLNGTTQHQN